MSSNIKTILFFLLFSMATQIASADRGGFRRKKSKITLNITLHNNFRSSILSNFRTGGLTYIGSTLLSQQTIGHSIFENNLITYKKGSTVYILPYRQKIIMPQYSPTTGYKVVIRP
jgi:hypothetical protein